VFSWQLALHSEGTTLTEKKTPDDEGEATLGRGTTFLNYDGKKKQKEKLVFA